MHWRRRAACRTVVHVHPRHISIDAGTSHPALRVSKCDSPDRTQTPYPYGASNFLFHHLQTVRFVCKSCQICACEKQTTTRELIIAPHASQLKSLSQTVCVIVHEPPDTQGIPSAAHFTSEWREPPGLPPSDAPTSSTHFLLLSRSPSSAPGADSPTTCSCAACA